MKPVNVLVLTGDGLNCERETARAFNLAGGNSTIVHVNDLLDRPRQIKEFDIFALPGGFSFGDEINSGKILALKLKYGLGVAFKEFIQNDGLVIGICNGFQALVKLGLLPDADKDRFLTLSFNQQKSFLDRWVELQVHPKSPCVWTKQLPESFSLPVRHGEGRIVFKQGKESLYQKLWENGQVVLKYNEDINGSYEKIAGLCDETGRVFGLMPHPEAAVSKVLNPQTDKVLEEDTGLVFFKNAIEYCQHR